MKKTLAIAATAAAGAIVLTGCSGDDSGGHGGTDPADLTAEISYGYWDENQRTAMDALIDGFNETYPNVTVTPQVTPYANYFTKLQTQGTSKTLPDVFWMNGPNFQLYAAAGLLQPVPDEVDPANYPEALNDLYTFDGEQYGVPKDFDTVGVYYNTDLFDAAGVPVPGEGMDLGRVPHRREDDLGRVEGRRGVRRSRGPLRRAGDVLQRDSVGGRRDHL